MDDWLKYHRKFYPSATKKNELIERVGIGQCGIISADDECLTANQNKFMNDKLFYKLIRPGWGISKVKGFCNNKKCNFCFVYVFPAAKMQHLRSKLIELAKDFNQKYVLYISQNGRFELIDVFNDTSSIVSIEKEKLFQSNDKLPFYLTTVSNDEVVANVLSMGLYLNILKYFDTLKLQNV